MYIHTYHTRTTSSNTKATEVWLCPVNLFLCVYANAICVLLAACCVHGIVNTHVERRRKKHSRTHHVLFLASSMSSSILHSFFPSLLLLRSFWQRVSASVCLCSTCADVCLNVSVSILCLSVYAFSSQLEFKYYSKQESVVYVKTFNRLNVYFVPIIIFRERRKSRAIPLINKKSIFNH